MTPTMITVTEDTPSEEIADLLETHRIKRVPVMRNGEIVGVVSRADLLRGLVAREAAPVSTASDADLKTAVEQELEKAAVAINLSASWLPAELPSYGAWRIPIWTGKQRKSLLKASPG